MALVLCRLKEMRPGEKRVALTPEIALRCQPLGDVSAGYDVRPETMHPALSLRAKCVDTGVAARTEEGDARELTAEERVESAPAAA